MTPDEIRMIRQRLGLSQVEAGELIGGGPRAFTKYEAGAIKPAAAVVNLLRLLEDHPAAIATLQGAKSRSTASAAATPFDVTGDNISALRETLLPRLLRSLLNAEALANRIPLDKIHVASNTYAADGGEDGRIEWKGGPDRTPFLPSRLNQFQLKAGRTFPATAAKEVLNRDDSVKKRVREVLAAGGNYIMLCAQPYTQNQIENREIRIRAALASAGLTIDGDQVDFRDADQIASWVNYHASVALWVKERTQPGTIGRFRSWSQWADRSEHYRSPWVEDLRLALLRERLREHATEPRKICRIVGLYGVGKSRLTLEALGPTRGLCLNDIVMCAVQSEVNPGDINRVVQSLVDVGTRAVVVVDDCDAETHQVLAGVVLRQSSRLSLVTIDNEAPSEKLDGNTTKIEMSEPAVTEGMLRKVLPGLQHGDRSRLERFSRGFPEIAVRLGRTWSESRPIADTADDPLVADYVLGRNPRDGDLLMRSAALLAVFGPVGIEYPAHGQLNEVASLGRNLIGEDFYAAVTELVDRGVAQRRGRLVTLKPLPIAMRLAERQWREWSPDTWDKVLSGDTSANLKVSAAKQLALLDTTDIAKCVVARVCRPQGVFDGLKGISQNGHAEVLSALCEIDPEVVVERIERSLSEVEDLSTVTAEVRRDLIWALEKIAFHSQTFEEAAHLLLRLAATDELQSRHYAGRDIRRLYMDSDAISKFKDLFPMHLGGTEADRDTRLLFLDEALDTHDPIQRDIVARALISGLETRNFSRILGPEAQGSRPAFKSWRPATQDEAVKYVEGCTARLAQLALKDDEAAVYARSQLGDALWDLVRDGFIDMVETVVHQVGDRVDYWPEALTGLRTVSAFHAKDLTPEVCRRVRKLAAELQPKSLEARIRSLVTETSWGDLECTEPDFDAHYQRRVEAVRGLAVELLKQPAVLLECLSQLSRGEQVMADAFGESIAELASSPLDWFDPIIQAAVETPAHERNYALLSGFVAGLSDDYADAVNVFKQEAARAPELAPAFPQVCRRLQITASDIQLVIGSLEDCVLAPFHLNEWSFGGKLTEVSPFQVAPLFDTMLDHSAEGFTEAVHLMGKFTSGDLSRLEELRPQVLKLAENSSRWKVARRQGRCKYQFQRIIGWMLSNGRQDSDACATALALAKAVVNAEEIAHDFLIKPLLPQLLSDFPEVSWPIIGQAIVSDSRRASRLGLVLGDTYSVRPSNKAALLSLPDAPLFAWCQANPNRAPAFVAKYVPFLTSQEDAPTEPSLNPIMAGLLDEFGDRDDVRQAVEVNIGNFGWSGSKQSYYVRYKQPLSGLLQHKRPKVRRWARTMLRRVDSEIEEARKQDEEREAQWE